MIFFLVSTALLLSLTTPSSACNEVVDFTFIDPSTSMDLRPISKVVSLDSLPSDRGINIRADIASCSVNTTSSVLVTFGDHQFCEEHAPYAVFQDNNKKGTDIASLDAKFHSRKLAVGRYTVSAIPFSDPGCIGPPGKGLRKNFRVVECNEIIDFTLVNPATSKDLGKLTKVIDLLALPTDMINIRADIETCSENPTASVLVKFGQHEFCEEHAPYSIFQDNNKKGMDIPSSGAKYFSRKLGAGGVYQVSAVPFSEAGCTGTPGKSLARKFDVIDGVCPGKVVGFRLWSTADKKSMDILDGGEFCNPGSPLSVEALVEACPTGQLRSNFLEMVGPTAKVVTRMEQFAPYTLFGDVPGRLYGRRLVNGSYTVTSTPYSRFNMRGAQGHVGGVSFTLKACETEGK